MGKQINFYTSPADEAEFMEFLKSDRDVVVMAYTSPTAEPVLLETLPPRNVPGCFMLWLWDRTHSPSPKLRKVPEQGYYVVDRMRSEVIELSRSYLADDGLIRGRIWAETDYWDLDQSPPRRVSKSEDFRKWFDRLAGWIKRQGRQDDSGDYVLPGAANYEASGGRLRQVHMARDVRRIDH